MTDRPILFTGPMVRALLDRRKTQTRRVLKAPKWAATPPEYEESAEGGIDAICEDTGCFARVPSVPLVGDRLWVRETWTARMTGGWTIADARSRMFQNEILYAADEPTGTTDGWWPSIHMPREFSRLTLLVTDVRVQHLHDIDEADAIAEGCGQYASSTKLHRDRPFDPSCKGSYREGFSELWEGLNAARGYGWADNPWVVVLTFTVLHQNIDALGAREAA